MRQPLFCKRQCKNKSADGEEDIHPYPTLSGNVEHGIVCKEVAARDRFNCSAEMRIKMIEQYCNDGKKTEAINFSDKCC